MKPLLGEAEIDQGVGRLAKALCAPAASRPLTIVGILTGSLVLLADVIRQIPLPLRVGLVQANSYRGPSTSPGSLAIDAKMLPDIEGRDVVVLDDIFDTGHTMVEVLAQLARMKPSTLRSAVLLRKEGRCEVDYQPDHVAFEIPNVFVVGYGLDYNDHYRNLPYIAALDKDDLRKASSE